MSVAKKVENKYHYTRLPLMRNKRIRIEMSIGVAVVSAVATGPPLNRALDGTGTKKSEHVFKGSRRVVRTVCPEAVISGSDT